MRKGSEASGWVYCFSKCPHTRPSNFHVADRGGRTYLCDCAKDYAFSLRIKATLFRRYVPQKNKEYMFYRNLKRINANKIQVS